MCFVGCICCLVVFGVVCGSVDDDCGVCKVVFLYVFECPFKCECQMFGDVVLYLRFVVIFVDLVHCFLYVFCLRMSVVAVVKNV